MYLFVTGFSFVAAQTSACPSGYYLDTGANTCLPNSSNSGYTVLAPLPGTTQGNCNASDTGNSGCQSTLATYLPGLFNLMIGVGAVSAFVVITIFGFEYMFTNSAFSKQNARTWVENALWGLGLIIFAYAILYTVNPNLVKGSLNITTPNVVAPSSLIAVSNPCSTDTSSTCTAEQNAELALKDENVNMIACTSINCPTQAAGFTQNTIKQLGALETGCGCNVYITGGSETSVHDTGGSHPAGTGVDLQLNNQLTGYLQKNSGETMPAQPVAGATYNVTINGQPAKALYEVTGTQVTTGGSVSTGPHWHITF